MLKRFFIARRSSLHISKPKKIPGNIFIDISNATLAIKSGGSLLSRTQRPGAGRNNFRNQPTGTQGVHFSGGKNNKSRKGSKGMSPPCEFGWTEETKKLREGLGGRVQPQPISAERGKTRRKMGSSSNEDTGYKIQGAGCKEKQAPAR